jgi:hypothetical protein
MGLRTTPIAPEAGAEGVAEAEAVAERVAVLEEDLVKVVELLYFWVEVMVELDPGRVELCPAGAVM